MLCAKEGKKENKETGPKLVKEENKVMKKNDVLLARRRWGAQLASFWTQDFPGLNVVTIRENLASGSRGSAQLSWAHMAWKKLNLKRFTQPTSSLLHTSPGVSRKRNSSWGWFRSLKTARAVPVSITLLSPTMTITWNLVKWNEFNLKADWPYWNEEGMKTAGEN